MHAGTSLSTTAACVGGRLEDELHITLNKALSHSSPVYKRIGIVGGLAMLRQGAQQYASLVSLQTTDDTHKQQLGGCAVAHWE